MAVKIKRVIEQQIDIPGIGDRIRQARESSSESLTALAKKAEISRSYWYQLESEKIDSVTEKVLRKVEFALGIDLGVKFDD